MNSLTVYSPDPSDRMPPANVEVEKALLGGILLDQETADDVFLKVQPEDFWRADHRVVARAIRDMRRRGQTIDTPALYEELSSTGMLERAGGLETIREIRDAAPHAANTLYHAEVVRQKSLARQIIAGCAQAIEAGYTNMKSADQLTAMVEQLIMTVTADRATRGITTLSDAMALEANNVRQRANGVTVGIPTGFQELDEKIDGFQPTNLIVLAARPGRGKTSLALNFAERCCLEFRSPVLFVSQEMSDSELGGRSLSSLTKIDHAKIKTGKLTPAEFSKIDKAISEVKAGAEFFIVDQGGQSVSDIAATARRLKNQHGLAIIFVDYIQLLESDANRGANRQEQVARISRDLKRLAMELKIPVVALSQLNRNVENREGEKPRLSDLRESGAIENDANVVLLLHQQDEAANVVDCIIAKNRNGPTGEVRMTFLKNLMRFENYYPDQGGF